VANKLFLACCEQFVAPECHFLCQYETDHGQAKKMVNAWPVTIDSQSSKFNSAAPSDEFPLWAETTLGRPLLRLPEPGQPPVLPGPGLEFAATFGWKSKAKNLMPETTNPQLL
jgi:hypothetical protein